MYLIYIYINWYICVFVYTKKKDKYLSICYTAAVLSQNKSCVHDFILSRVNHESIKKYIQYFQNK